MSRDSGEKMTDDELAEHLSTLLGDGLDATAAGGPLDEDAAADLLERRLPAMIDADVFINSVVGLEACRPYDEMATQSSAAIPSTE